MPRRSLIHIGYHKTATTWFQKEFYPTVHDARYVPPVTLQRALIQPRPFQFDVKQARKILDWEEDKRLILCDEELSGNIHVGGLHGCATVEFARRLRATFPDADVIIFGRDLVDHVASAYHQYVKEGGTRSPAKYVFGRGHQHRNPTFSLDHFRTRALADHYRSLFGPDRVHVFRFEDFAADPVRFVAGYAERLELAFHERDIDWERRPNPRLGKRVLLLARLLNLLTARDVAEKYYLMNLPRFYETSRLLIRWLNRYAWIRGSDSPRALLGASLVARVSEKGRQS